MAVMRKIIRFRSATTMRMSRNEISLSASLSPVSGRRGGASCPWRVETETSVAMIPYDLEDGRWALPLILQSNRNARGPNSADLDAQALRARLTIRFTLNDLDLNGREHGSKTFRPLALRSKRWNRWTQTDPTPLRDGNGELARVLSWRELMATMEDH